MGKEKLSEIIKLREDLRGFWILFTSLLQKGPAGMNSEDST
jgi:hypothetical protein